MNKRQKKKFEKKLRCKKYCNVRRERIMMRVNKYALKLNLSKNDAFNMVYIVDSKRMDLKHPLKIQLLANCVPVSSSFDNVDKDATMIADNKNKVVTLEWGDNHE